MTPGNVHGKEQRRRVLRKAACDQIIITWLLRQKRTRSSRALCDLRGASLAFVCSFERAFGGFCLLRLLSGASSYLRTVLCASRIVARRVPSGIRAHSYLVAWFSAASQAIQACQLRGLPLPYFSEASIGGTADGGELPRGHDRSTTTEEETMPRRPERAPRRPFAPKRVVRWLDDGCVTRVLSGLPRLHPAV